MNLVKKANLYYLAKTNSPGTPFYLYINTLVKNPRTDFKGLKIRSLPQFDKFVDALGATRVTTSRADLYAALERGVIDGHFLTANLRGWNLQEVSKYRVEAPFFVSSIGFYTNLDAWNELPKHLQDLLEQVGADQEREMAPIWVSDMANETAFVLEAGVELIEFSKADTEWFIEQAYSTAWKRMLEQSPQYGAALKARSG